MISLKRIFCTCCLLLSVWAVFAQGPSEWKALEKPLNFYLAALIVNLPGSVKAVSESMDFLMGNIEHGLDILLQYDSECGR